MSQQKACGRCESQIACHASDISSCPCSEISLSSDTINFLTTTTYNCLCNRCLHELDKMVVLAKSDVFPKLGDPLKEGIHFYLENELFVFTEYYHLLRGHCCQSECRHCAYGYQSE